MHFLIRKVFTQRSLSRMSDVVEKMQTVTIDRVEAADNKGVDYDKLIGK